MKANNKNASRMDTPNDNIGIANGEKEEVKTKGRHDDDDAKKKNRNNNNRIINKTKKKKFVSLFAFSDVVDDDDDDGGDAGGGGDDGGGGPGGRRRFPKRKLKCVVKFDPRSSGGGGGARGGGGAGGRPESCKAGHGFGCPRCHRVCSYDSRSCPGCGLNCYYEAGVGVVVLKERDDFTNVNPQRGAYPREGTKGGEGGQL